VAQDQATVHTTVRHQQQVEALCAGAIRALSAQAGLHFRSRRLYRGTQLLPLFAPHLHPVLDRDDFASFRGAADGLALRLRRSDAELHRQHCPTDPVERLLFELLEQTRVESLVPAGMPGLADNLRHRHAAWLHNFHASGLTETARGLLLFTVVQICRMRVTGEPVLEDTEDLMETTRGALSPLIGHDLAGLRRQRHDQAAYAVHALNIARLVAQMSQGAQDDANDSAPTPTAPDPDRAAFSLMMDLEADPEEGVSAAVTGRSLVLQGAQNRYQVFTRAYDRELRPATLVRPAQLREYREQLDRRIASEKFNIGRLSRELRALLALPQRDGWDGEQEEGHIDGRQLARLIASPAERRLFRTEHLTPVADCVVSFLMDCSGSMKQHMLAVATWVDVLARALEQAGAQSEVLGFSTGAWNGGRAQRDWQRSGKPPHPGRLNEASHLVFKEAATSWQRARAPLAALLKADLFREGIDGEAVDWAAQRLAKLDARRRLLIVISDGCPMDRATEMANDAFYLDNHLKDVAQRLEQGGQIELFGVGVGLDLSPYYTRNVALDLSDATGPGALREVLGLLAKYARR
jgi:cobaltochelatase CobT